MLRRQTPCNHRCVVAHDVVLLCGSGHGRAPGGGLFRLICPLINPPYFFIKRLSSHRCVVWWARSLQCAVRWARSLSRNRRRWARSLFFDDHFGGGGRCLPWGDFCFPPSFPRPNNTFAGIASGFPLVIGRPSTGTQITGRTSTLRDRIQHSAQAVEAGCLDWRWLGWQCRM